MVVVVLAVGEVAASAVAAAVAVAVVAVAVAVAVLVVVVVVVGGGGVAACFGDSKTYGLNNSGLFHTFLETDVPGFFLDSLNRCLCFFLKFLASSGHPMVKRRSTNTGSSRFNNL